jgi:hypothetical protein
LDNRKLLLLVWKAHHGSPLLRQKRILMMRKLVWAHLPLLLIHLYHVPQLYHHPLQLDYLPE